MDRVKASIAGGSGYVGGELLRLLLFHGKVEISQVTSESLAGKSILKAHPNLRKRTQLQFSKLSDLGPCDVLFLSLPHGSSMERIRELKTLAPRIIDLSADFRLHRERDYEDWYGKRHACPELLKEFVYGIPELHREEMRQASLISSAGCNATVTILGLYPFFKLGLVDLERTVVEVKVGSSEGGNTPSAASHHPERSGAVRSFMPTNHRHGAEIVQELSFGKAVQIHLSVTSIEMVRGALATAHVFLKDPLEEKDIWKVLRQVYGQEPFIRIVKESDGTHRYPEPKWLAGTNYCDIGFSKDEKSNRLVVISAIDNLMKGAAGQAVQAFNIMHGFEETEGLEFPGLHPI
ncbi:MAG: N-acetyl-gamma-glutamyl-phosphate reductase [Ignavibacteria bacterium GWA2_54_16]|nr:MAG: N-acetyl-gamma-glutamyl-phosphate reductase [Ignavibacteria bacterium GWA2_54_16]